MKPYALTDEERDAILDGVTLAKATEEMGDVTWDFEKTVRATIKATLFVLGEKEKDDEG